MSAGDKSKTSLMKLKFTWLSRGLMLLYAMTVCLLCFTHFDGSINMNEEWFGIGKDKIAHFLMFLPFPVISYLSLPHVGDTPLKFLRFCILDFIAGVMLGAAIELLQGVEGFRSADVKDLFADCCGLAAAIFCLQFFEAFIKKRRKSVK